MFQAKTNAATTEDIPNTDPALAFTLPLVSLLLSVTWPASMEDIFIGVQRKHLKVKGYSVLTWPWHSSRSSLVTATSPSLRGHRCQIHPENIQTEGNVHFPCLGLGNSPKNNHDNGIRSHMGDPMPNP